MFLLVLFSDGRILREVGSDGSSRSVSWRENFWGTSSGILVLSIFFINFKLFFFGFLAEKWKRLVRTILIIGVISLIIYLEDRRIVYEEGIAILISFVCIPSISLISWVVKPFITKQKL
jgi:hypothetical protein